MHKCNTATGSTVFFSHWLPDWTILCASIDQVAPVRGLGPMFHSHNLSLSLFCLLFRMGVLMWWRMMQETEWLLLLLPIEMTSRYVEGPHDCQGLFKQMDQTSWDTSLYLCMFWWFSIYPDCRYCSKARTDLELCQHGAESETAAGQKVTYAAHNTASAVGLHLFLR